MAEFLRMEDVPHRILAVRINETYERFMPSNEQELYDIIRGVWVAALDRVKQVDYVWGVYEGRIVGCYKPDRWYRASEFKIEDLPKQAEDVDNLDKRVLFECDDITASDKNRAFYLHKSIAQLGILESQNPIAYINV